MPKQKMASHARTIAKSPRSIGSSDPASKSEERNVQILHGVTPDCVFAEPEQLLSHLAALLANTGRVFRRNGSVVFESRIDGVRRLKNLTTDGQVMTNAGELLGNLVRCEYDKRGELMHVSPPNLLVKKLVNHEPALETLPVINAYAQRPVFDSEFRFLIPGWHPESGTLVHGPAVQAIVPEPGTRESGALGQRLPPRLRELLDWFPFKSDADRVNAVGAMLTGMLGNHFVTVGKPLFVIDGNKPSVGKSLLANLIAILLDGEPAKPIGHTPNEDEYGKRICATLRRGCTVIVIDNVKTRPGSIVESAVLEACTTAPQISQRILGQSRNHEQPNDVLFVMTMNQTKLGPDLTERHCPIRLHSESDAKKRPPAPNLIEFANTHRLELLGELAGMILRWVDDGKPQGTQEHRLSNWARTIGGILDVNGLRGFLSNLDEATREFNPEFAQLTALIETVDRLPGEVSQRLLIANDIEQSRASGMTAGELNDLLQQEGSIPDNMAKRPNRQSAVTVLGTFLSDRVGKEVSAVIGGKTVQATLERTKLRANATGYYFKVRPAVLKTSVPDR